MQAELIFIRHGETVWNLERRLQGRGDSPLTPRGRDQVAAHLQWLPKVEPVRLLASPLGRARASAAILAVQLGLQVEYQDALMERSMGIFEGWSLEELERHQPQAARARREDPWYFRAPEGENFPDMLTRVAPLLDDLAAADAGPVVIVSHGSLVRPMLGHLLGLPRAQMLRVLQPNDLAYRLVPGKPVQIWRHRGARVEPGLLMSQSDTIEPGQGTPGR